MGSLALQDIKGVTMMVLKRSLGCSNAREAIRAGTVHPKPKRRGRNARPDNPRQLIISSMTNATLDIYPLSSRIARARKRMKILGKNVRIPPTPAMIPSRIKEESMGFVCIASSPPDTKAEKFSNPISKYPFSQSPIVKVKKNTSAIINDILFIAPVDNLIKL